MKKKIKFTITQDALRLMRKKADRELGLQKINFRCGPHKTFKDKPRVKKIKDIEQW